MCLPGRGGWRERPWRRLWAGAIGASGWPFVGMGSKKVEAECVFAGLGLVGAVFWAAFGRAGVIGEAGWPFAGLGLVGAVF